MRRLAILLTLVAAAPAAAQQPSADSARVYELSEVEVLPRPQNAADFTAALRDGYPPHLRTAGVGGTVQVAFVVGPDGVPGDVQVLATPDSGFNAPTVQAVSRLRFSPAQVQGRAVRVRVEQPITWRVEPAPAVVAPSTDSAAGNSENGYELREVDELPRLLNGLAFQQTLAREFPESLLEARVSGSVEVRFRVDEDGTTSHHVITRSSDRRFNEVTLRVMRVLRFRPARKDGRPVKVWVVQPIMWSLPPAGMRPDRGPIDRE